MEQKQEQEMGPPEAQGPFLPKASTPPVLPLEEGSTRPVVLVLGPGLARGFAHAGIIQGLRELKIEIIAVYGTEMGALVAALYSTSSTMNQFEWSLQHFKEDSFLKPRGFLSKTRVSPHGGEKLDQQLEKVFADKKWGNAKIKLMVALQSEATGIPFTVDEGPLRSAIRGALNAPSILFSTPFLFKNDPLQVVAATKTAPFLVDEAKALNLGPVIVVNVLRKVESSFALSELKKADLILEPQLEHVDYFDYKKRNEIIYQGKKLVQDRANEIKQLLRL